MVFSKYDKGRPFLVVTQNSRPAEGENTSTKNWGKTGKKVIQEMVSIVDTVKDKHLFEAAVIVDVLQRRIVKSRFSDDNSATLTHYLTQYKKEIAEGIQVWMSRQYENQDEAQAFMDNLDSEIVKMDVPTDIVDVVPDETVSE